MSWPFIIQNWSFSCSVAWTETELPNYADAANTVPTKIPLCLLCQVNEVIHVSIIPMNYNTLPDSVSFQLA